VLPVPGAAQLVLATGINDIAFSSDPMSPVDVVGAEDLVAGLSIVAAAGHARRLRVVGCTLTPFKGVPDNLYSDDGENKRRTVNAWLRTTRVFDAVADLDRVLADPADPRRLDPRFDSGDHVHPNDAGQALMAAEIDSALQGAARPI
jgi:hypothetical protein